MRTPATLAVLGLLLIALLGATPGPSTTALPSAGAAAPQTAESILARMVAARKGLETFSVPVHFDVKLHRPLPIAVPMDGVRYFERVDKQALIMHSVPSIAKAFAQTYATLGTAETWPREYDITLVALDPPASATMYELRGVPKRSSSVDHVLLDVATDTVAPLRARWFYRNGSTIDMSIENSMVNGAYLLPKTETLDVKFPSYAGQAVVHYGDYSINLPIPASVWATPRPSPSP
jgi:hypothetical protein